jgi:stage II sporulation protein M
MRDLKDTKGYVYLASAIFAAAAVGGAIFSERLLDILGPFKELAESISGQNPLIMVLMIFVQNSFSTLLSVWLGFLFCLVPLYTLLLNGVVLGVLFSVTETNILVDLMFLLPHGIFELPAVFVATGLGIWRGVWFVRERGRNSERAHTAYRVYFRIVLPLLLVAAVIEGVLIALATSI